MNSAQHTISPKRKALAINLDGNIYGTFAEIGAGQEVVRHFFRAGGASGTIAKAMSAYDKDFSDAIYGKEETNQYVCKPRLQKMLNREYGLMVERLDRKEHPEKKFFAYANTIATVNYDKTRKGQGWMGMRYQTAPNAEPNNIVIHIRLHDLDASQQQEAIGLLGLNLVYSCFHYEKRPMEALSSLYDNLTRDRVEIDMINLEGPDFNHIDNRLLSLQLVKNGMTDAVIFGSDGNNVHPSEVLYKKNILAIRGRFKPVTKVHLDMFQKGFDSFVKNNDLNPSDVVPLFELTLNNLHRSGKEIDEQDFMDRADLLCSLGQTVLISNYSTYHNLVRYFSTYSQKKMGLIMGVKTLEEIFLEKYYSDLDGGILEAIGIMFTKNMKIFLYPFQAEAKAEVLNSSNLTIPRTLRPLFEFLIKSKRIVDLKDYNPELLQFFSDEVVSMIKSGKKGWEKQVPGEVDKLIKSKHLFGYK